MKEGNPIFSKEVHARSLKRAVEIVALTYITAFTLRPLTSNVMKDSDDGNNQPILFPCDSSGVPIPNPEVDRIYDLCVVDDRRTYRGPDAYRVLFSTPSPEPAPAPTR